MHVARSSGGPKVMAVATRAVIRVHVTVQCRNAPVGPKSGSVPARVMSRHIQLITMRWAKSMASACLPTMFRAVEIDGEPYWDGGFAGNPTITPLVRESDAHDTILVQINPRERRNTPKTAGDILDRLNEISFNAPLLKELRMIALLRQAADPGSGEGARWAGMRTHRIMTDRLAEFGASSKLNAEWEFLEMLKVEGRKSAADFLTSYGADLGSKSSADLDVLLAEC